MAEAQKVIGLVEEAVLGEPGSLSEETPLEGLEGWDSASMVFFVGEAAGRFGIELSADELRGATTVGDLFRLILRKTTSPAAGGAPPSSNS